MPDASNHAATGNATGSVTDAATGTPVVRFSHTEAGSATITLGGTWNLDHIPDGLSGTLSAVEALRPPATVTFHIEQLGAWGSTLVALVINLVRACRANGIDPDCKALPEGLQRLMQLAFAVPERAGAARSGEKKPFLERVGALTLLLPARVADVLSFLGDVTIALGRMVRGKADFRWSDMLLMMQECGSTALPIVSLISLLVGLILAFVGAVQLRAFGAQIYVADLVGIAMIRVMGAVMAGITMAGRTGASYAAVLGTMQVNEEVDALSTLGISPAEFLVLPRLVALVIMMPLLTIYADLMGVLGGLIVGVGMLDLNPMEYLIATREAVNLTNLWIGIVHGTLFGIVISLCGCYNGIRCGRSASAVGNATTAAVVSSIISIIVATAIVTVICEVLHV